MLNPSIMKKFILLSVLFISYLMPANAKTTIAVLPYKIVYEGRIPKKFTPELIAESRLQEGRSYQASMINYLTKMNRKRANRELDVVILSQGEIDALIAKNQLRAGQLDSLTNKQLAEILGISHVVRGSATRTFIMSDELSLGITAVSIVTGQPLINTTSSINLINSLEDVETSGTVYSKQFMRTTSATRSDEQNLRDTFRKSSRRMFRQLRN
jgi:hypothetical protein